MADKIGDIIKEIDEMTEELDVLEEMHMYFKSDLDQYTAPVVVVTQTKIGSVDEEPETKRYKVESDVSCAKILELIINEKRMWLSQKKYCLCEAMEISESIKPTKKRKI